MGVLGIIPARAGSKGVVNKNRLVIDGLPLIEYSINAAIESKRINLIVLSTDDEEIEKIGKKEKKLIVRKRPRSIAGDNSPISETIFDVLNKYKKLIKKNQIDSIMLLQPTSPIRTSSDIDKAIHSLYSTKDYNSLISVCEMDDIHPGRMYWINSDTAMENVLPKYENTMRQDNTPVYLRNGAIYLTWIDKFLKTSNIINYPILPYKMNPDYLLNIDSKRDVIIANAIMKAWKDIQSIDS